MRNMSFMLTTNQIKAETKRVTRRLGWWFVKDGDIIMAVEKGMGLKKGEKIVRLKPIIMQHVYPERLCNITLLEVELEGFPGKSPEWFVDMFCSSHKKCVPETIVNRMFFSYLHDGLYTSA